MSKKSRTDPSDMTCSSVDYADLFSQMPVPRFVVRVVEKGYYVVSDINDLALRYFDLDKSQIVGQRVQDFMNNENALHFQQSFEVCFSKKKPVSIQALPGIPGSVRVHGFYISPILDEEGIVQFFDVIGQLDVADQSILQRERDDAMSLLTSVFEVGEIGILVTDHMGRIVRVNESFIRNYGWSRDELINTNIAELFTPEQRDLARKNHDEFIQTGVTSSGEMKLLRKDGTIVNGLFTSATMELSQRRRFQVTTIMDITLRKQMEESARLAKEQADAASRAKSSFLANMSHELRTPLNAIIGFSEMMLKETFGPLGHEKYVEYTKDVHGSAEHLLEIINEVLDMSKIEAGRVDLDEVDMDIRDVIRPVMRMIEARAFGNDLDLILDIEDGFPRLYADQKLVRQIFINLITNAVKFSEQDGEVKVSASITEDGCMVVTIADQGIGIAPDKIEEALEPFGQVSDTDLQGTGLGLPLAKAMSEMHDGSLDLTSQLGEGTVVSVVFPAERVVGSDAFVARYSDHK